MRKVLALTAVSVVLTACEGRLPANVTRTDSAGVSIVTTEAARMTEAPTWSLSAVPIEKIQDPGDSSFTLSRVGDVVPLPGKQLGVASAGASQILVFNEDGHLALRFGRRGDGPGEFRHISSLVPLSGDSLGVFDGAHQTLSLFDRTGLRGRRVSLGDLIAAAGGSTGATRLEALKDGDLALITLPGFGAGQREGVYRPESRWLRIDSRGDSLASYGSFPGHEVYVTENSRGRPLFGRITAFATSGEDLVVGTGATTEFRLLDPKGAVKRIVRWPDGDRKVTDARIDSAVDVAAAMLPAAQQAAYRDAMGKMPHGDAMPPYQTIVASGDGYVWVGGYADETRTLINSRPTPPLHWLVFAPNGALAAKVETPFGFELRALDGSRAIGVQVDASGQESVQVYTVEGMARER